MSIESDYPRSMFAASELAHQLRAALIPLAERTSAQLHELHKDPTGDRAFIAAQAAAEVYAHLIRFGTELDRR